MGFIFVELALAAMFFLFSYQKKRKFFAWFGVGMIINAITTFLQSMDMFTAAIITILLFWTTMVIAVVVMIQEYREFAAKEKENREKGNKEE